MALPALLNFRKLAGPTFMADDNMPIATPCPTRRAVLAGGVALLGEALARPAISHPIDNPPVFETTRHQFTMLEPRLTMKGVTLASLTGVPKLVAPAPGKITLVNFWATWCLNCRTELPAMAELQRIMGNRIQVEAISTDRIPREQVREFVSDLGIKGLSISVDPNGLFGELNRDGQFPTFGMPITYLVTPAGLIAGYIVDNADWLSKAGQALLAYYS